MIELVPYIEATREEVGMGGVVFVGVKNLVQEDTYSAISIITQSNVKELIARHIEDDIYETKNGHKVRLTKEVADAWAA